MDCKLFRLVISVYCTFTSFKIDLCLSTFACQLNQAINIAVSKINKEWSLPPSSLSSDVVLSGKVSICLGLEMGLRFKDKILQKHKLTWNQTYLFHMKRTQKWSVIKWIYFTYINLQVKITIKISCESNNILILK